MARPHWEAAQSQQASPPSTTPYTAGTHSLTAVYAGDANNTASTSAAISQVVAAQLVYYIQDDQLDTPRTITDTGGNVVWQWDNTDPFGNNAANENPNGAGQFSFNLRFPGQYADKETSLSYNFFRDYDSSTGRYIESDPIGLEGGINSFVYVLDNPFSYSDPLGLNPFSSGTGGGQGACAYCHTPIIPPSVPQPAPPTVLPGETQGNGGPLPAPPPTEARSLDKERATDAPSWSLGYAQKPGEGCGDYAARILKQQYGCDDPRAQQRGPGSEYSKIKKYCERRWR